MEPYVKIYEWMLDLGLNVRELNALAVIVGFWKGGRWFQGSASYLGRWMGGATSKTVRSALSSLVEKGFVEKRERWEKGEKMCDYRPGQKLPRGRVKISPGREEITQGTGEKITAHTNRPDSNSDSYKEKKEIYKEMVHLSVDEFIARRTK